MRNDPSLPGYGMDVFPHQPQEPALRDLSRQLLARGDLIGVLDRLPYMALILTPRLEAVFANQSLLQTLGLTSIESTLTQRPGELLLCTHSRAQGCGGAEGCRQCQAQQVIVDCLHSHQKVVREARVSSRVDGRLIAYDLRVTATPLEFAGQELVMVFFEDIGAVKRREHLERIFIHDLLNTVGSLQLLSELQREDPARVRPEEFARQVRLLTDEIRAQQILIDAERGDLARNIQCIPVQELLRETLDGIEVWSAKCGIAISVDQPAAPVYLATDALLARRVLLNAVKNAVEASAVGETVTVGVSHDGPTVAITVRNAAEMAASTRRQVFQRSFSTKGKGRGLGTYSMRLLMENYLGGEVSFTSDADTGTTFTLVFPSMQGYLAAAG